MAFFKIDVEMEWLGLASICAFATYIIYRKANRLPDLPKLSCDQVRETSEEISKYFQLFYEKFDDAYNKLLDTHVADIQLLSSWKDHCKIKFSGLINECQSKGDVIMFVRDFAADLSNSRLYKVISDKDAEIEFQKADLLVSIEYLKKVCGNITSVFTTISSAPSTWFKDEEIKEMISSKLNEALRLLNGWRVDSFFKAENFKVCEVAEFLEHCIKQLNDNK